MKRGVPLGVVFLLAITTALAISQEPAIHHIVGTGQSLSIGGQSQAHTAAVAGHLGLTVDRTAFVSPLGEPVARAKFQETHHSSMAAMIGALAPGHTTLHTAAGRGNCEYDCLRKDGTGDPYALSLAQITAARDLALAAGRPYSLTAVTLVHGERDHNLGSTTYYTDLLELQADYQADAGQGTPLPLFLSQMHAWTAYGSPTSTIPLDQLRAAVDNPDIYMVMPKYSLPYTDGIHLTWDGYQQMGEMYGKAYHRVVVEGEPWAPLRPLAVTCLGRYLFVRFHVPVPPLVLDTESVSNPGDYGFEYWDDGGPSAAIERVDLLGGALVRVTLDRVPTGGNQRLRYAYSGEPWAPGGPTTGARGNLRDSDATPSLHGYHLWNWCVTFDEPVRPGCRVWVLLPALE